jgi:hypothetical protein
LYERRDGGGGELGDLLSCVTNRQPGTDKVPNV